jgi:Ca2+-binding RTX toxin-like protein
MYRTNASTTRLLSAAAGIGFAAALTLVGTGPARAAVSPVTCAGVPATIVYNGIGNITFGTQGRDVIVTFDADDIIWALDGDDLICSGGGNDSVHASWGDDTVFSEAGNDEVDGAADDDTLYGGTGNDFLMGSTGSDFADGGAGTDRCTLFDLALNCERR